MVVRVVMRALSERTLSRVVAVISMLGLALLPRMAWADGLGPGGYRFILTIFFLAALGAVMAFAGALYFVIRWIRRRRRRGF